MSNENINITFVQNDGSLKHQSMSLRTFMNVVNFRIVKDIAGMLIADMSEEQIKQRLHNEGWIEDDKACEEVIDHARDYIFNKYGFVLPK